MHNWVIGVSKKVQSSSDSLIQRNIRLFYGYSTFINLDFSRGIFLLFFLSEGFSHSQIGVLQTLLFWSSFLFEVPAGVVADRFKRKYSLVIGALLLGGAYVGILYSSTLWIAAFFFIAIGVGFAFQSGADSAFLYDELGNAGKKWQKQYLKFSARARNLGTIAITVAIATGGWLQGLSWEWVYFSCAGAALVAGILIAITSEQPRKTDGQAVSGFRDLLKNIRQFFAYPQGKQLFLFIIGMGLIEAAHTPLFIYAQLYFKSRGVQESAIGLIIAMASLSTAMAYLWVEKLPKWKIQWSIVLTALFLSGGIGLFFFSVPVVVLIGLFFVLNAVPNLLYVLTDYHINEQLPSSIRASLLSVQSLVTSLLIGVSYLSVGWIMGERSEAFGIGLLSVCPLFGALVVLFYRPVLEPQGESK